MNDNIKTIIGAIVVLIIIFKIIKNIINKIKQKRQKRIEYENTSYYKITKIPLLEIKKNTGKYGEYLIYQEVKHFENIGVKFLFNVYIPKENNETTEIDVMLISKYGIIVIESKNFNGWIFGNENKKYWYQTLSNGYDSFDKYEFYNPIKQNENHIKYLKRILEKETIIKSIVVFSNTCILKNIIHKDRSVEVINRFDLKQTIEDFFAEINHEILSKEEIENIYIKLYPYTQVSDETKKQHIENIVK